MKSSDKKLLIIFGALLLIVALILHFRPKKVKLEKLSILKNNSQFFTVSSCVSKYYNYVKDKDATNILVLLDSSYVKKNNIDENTVLSYVDDLSENQKFRAFKMYSEQIKKNVYKYYVYGEIVEEIINSEPEHIKDVYLIVYLNEDGMIFSVEPYDGEIFNK